MAAQAAAPVANDDVGSVSEDGILVVNAGGTGGSGLAGGGAFGVVAEATNYTLVYEMAIPDNLVVGASVPFPYTVNNSETVGELPFDRVAYYLELETSLGSGTTWVYVSMDAFTTDIAHLAIPHPTDNPVLFQQIVNNMNVYASDNANIVTGDGIATGNIEMWPSNYGGGNSIGIPNATGAYDFGDGGASTAAGYGSFQVHNHGASQTILGYTAFGNGGIDGLGIGNNTGAGNPDYTFAGNAASYTVKNLQILVRTTSPVVSTIAGNGAIGKVAEVSDYTLVYEMAIPNALDLATRMHVPYTANFAHELAGIPFSRIAYYMELDSGSGTEWVYASMDAYTNDITTIGLPHPTYNAGIRQQVVTNMNVFASAGAGVTTGTGIATGNIEMWPNNYGTATGLGTLGGNGGNYDFDDTTSGTVDGYGSFQVHNHGAGETLFAYNAFGSGSADCLGFGNRPTSHPDWTFAGNAASYSVKNLQVFVRTDTVLASGGAVTVVPEASDYELVYQLAIPNAIDHSASVPVPYSINNADALADLDFSRIAYYLELDTGTGLEWVYVSMDAFTDDIAQIGIPHPTSNAVLFQQIVNDMNAFSSAGAGVTNGIGIATGNIEMWPSNYNGNNTIGIPGAANHPTFDFGDGGANTTDGYGSFQIHNFGASETLLAYNAFGSGNADCLGIGNQPAGNPDWTFANNSATYTVKNLQILVLPEGLLANDTDADGDSITITAAATVAPAPTGGIHFATTSAQGAAVTVFPNGSYIYDPSNAPGIHALASGQTTIDTFYYLADDGAGGSDDALVSITVSGVTGIENDTAVVRKSGPPIIIDVLANDTPAVGAITSVTANTDGGPGGLVTNNGGNITYDPNGQFNSLTSGETAIDVFTYTTASGTAKVTVTIEGSVGTVIRWQ